ncbi:hypothetical protein D9M71_488170 [compost metagenome]
MLRHRIVEAEAPLAIGNTEHAGHHTLAHRPDQMRRLRPGRAGVALIDQLAVADHHHGVGAYAFAGLVIARRKGVGLEGGQGRAWGSWGTGPGGVWPGFVGLGRDGECQEGEEQQAGEDAGHSRGSCYLVPGRLEGECDRLAWPGSLTLTLSLRERGLFCVKRNTVLIAAPCCPLSLWERAGVRATGSSLTYPDRPPAHPALSPAASPAHCRQSPARRDPFSTTPPTPSVPWRRRHPDRQTKPRTG